MSFFTARVRFSGYLLQLEIVVNKAWSFAKNDHLCIPKKEGKQNLAQMLANSGHFKAFEISESLTEV